MDTVGEVVSDFGLVVEGALFAAIGACAAFNFAGALLLDEVDGAEGSPFLGRGERSYVLRFEDVFVMKLTELFD